MFLIFDTYSTIDVALRFYAKAGIAVLYKTAVTYDGYILCQKLLEWLNNIKLKNPPPLYQNVVLRETFRINLLTIILNQVIRRNDSNEPRQLSQTEMHYYDDYNRTDAIMWENVKKVYVANGGKRNNFDPSICWQLPMSSAGFVVYNQNDLHKDYPMAKRTSFKDEYGYDQIGTKETIDAMIHIAKEWANLNTGRQLQYGDISRPGGVNTPDHKTHNNGKAFDIRPLRKDLATGKEGNLSYSMANVYDRDLTKKFILLVVKLYPGTTFYFNDEELHRKDRDVNQSIEPKSGHNDHLHVMFPGGN